MSRIGKQQLTIPANTTVDFTDGVLTVKGPLGTLTKSLANDAVSINIDGSLVTFTPKTKIHLLALSGVHMPLMLKT